MLNKALSYTCILGSLLLPLAAVEKEPTPIKKEMSGSKREPSISQYLKLFQDHPNTFGPLGKWQNGEIEISTNPNMIQRIENQTRLRLIAKGIEETDAEAWSRIGIVAEDNYWMWIRDAVIFPSGVYGTYDRIMWKSGFDTPSGVAILPLLCNKKIIVNINYRHATRSWELELPRGGLKDKKESLESAVARELEEETGYHIHKCTLLGTIAPDSGMIMGTVPVFCGEACNPGESHHEFSEAIETNPAFTKEELRQGFNRGYIEIPIKGQLIKVCCRDPYLAYALLQAELKNLL